MSCQYELYEPSWCPGCGNYMIRTALKMALEELDIKPHEVVIVSGIGQAAKMPHYIKTNGFNGLHGRALPPAIGIKMANKNLNVIVESGDGDTYGEGGNHFIHAIRRNIDIAHFVHDNQIYGLTKGQASPTTGVGHVTGVQTAGTVNEPINPVLMAVALGAGFVARAFSGDKEHLASIMVEAIQYKGYSLVDIFQPCVTFNKINTFQWYNKRVYKLGDDYDPTDRLKAMEKAMEWGDRIPIGVIYREEKKTYCDKIECLREGEPLIDRHVDMERIKGYMKDFV